MVRFFYFYVIVIFLFRENEMFGGGPVLELGETFLVAILFIKYGGRMVIEICILYVYMALIYC